MIVEEDNDPYLIFSKVLFDYSYRRTAKIMNLVLIIFYSVLVFFELRYVNNHLSLDVVAKYGFEIIMNIYFTMNMCIVLVIENDIYSLLNEPCNFWRIDSVDKRIQNSIEKSAFKIKAANFFVIGVYFFGTILWFPVWGDVSGLLLVRLFKMNDGVWQIIPYYFYFATLPWVTFNGIRICESLLIAILWVQIQLTLLNEKIQTISVNYKDADVFIVQKKIYKDLCICISHHATLNGWISKLFDLVQTVMPFFMVLGLFGLIGIIFSFLYYLPNAPTIFKIRLLVLFLNFVFIVCLFSHAGQMFKDKTGGVFDVLQSCKWYLWDRRNQKLLLMFMTNSLQPKELALAGIALDYNFALRIVRTSYSAGMVFYNLQYR